MVGSLATAVAAMAMLVMGAGALGAQQSNDDGRMRTPSDYGDDGRWRSIVPGERIATIGQGGTSISLRDSSVWEV
jgi:hypothetical protein